MHPMTTANLRNAYGGESMEVDEKAAAATSEYKGKTYYFCAPGCKKSFDSDPEKYLANPGAH